MSEHEPSPIKEALKTGLRAVGGDRAVHMAKTLRYRLNMAPPTQVGAVTPTWTPPASGAAYGVVETPHGSVRVVPPRAELEPGSGRYPPAPPGPKVPRDKKPAWWSDLEFFPPMATAEHPHRWTFPAYLDNPNCAWLQVLKRHYDSPFSFPSSLSPEGGLLLHSMVRNIRPRRVIETGTFIGISTLWIAAALKENGDGGIVRCFDDFGPIHKAPYRQEEMLEGRINFVAEAVAAAGLQDHVVFHPGNSSFEIKAAHAEMKAEGGNQLAFIDADHGITGVWQDFWAVEPVLQVGGFACFHDTFPPYCSYDGPRHLLDHLNQQAHGMYEKVDMYLAPVNYGLGIVRRIG